MPICHSKKFIFFHIPRCGGTSFESIYPFNALQQCYGLLKQGEQEITLHHLTAIDMKNAGIVDDELLNSYFKFTIIRDPFDRMASDYVWQQYYDVHQLFADMSFADYLAFAEKVVEEGLYFDKRHFDHFRPMVMYCVHENQALVDDILLLDHIDQHLARISHKIGDITLPKKNSSPNYKHLRTSENLERVYELYAPDKALYDNIIALEN